MKHRIIIAATSVALGVVTVVIPAAAHAATVFGRF